MNLPRGRLRHSRVVDSPGAVLETALDRSLTGYVVFEPGDALLFDDATRGVMTFEEGVPVLVYDTASDCGGTEALSRLTGPGPYRVELYELTAADLAATHQTSTLRVPPDRPAERLADDAALAARTREAAPDEWLTNESHASAVEAFLADEGKIEAIQRAARDEAKRRADEWGLADALADDETATDGSSSADDEEASTESDVSSPAE